MGLSTGVLVVMMLIVMVVVLAVHIAQRRRVPGYHKGINESTAMLYSSVTPQSSELDE